MKLLVSLKVVRLLLAVCVSVWLAGGCLFGCSNMAMASESSANEGRQAAVEGDSCHTARQHDCCLKQKAAAKQSTVDPRQTESLLALNSVPQGMMRDCPLALNATAVTSKHDSNSTDPAFATSAALPVIAGTGALPQKHVVTLLTPNRGPTYLRCCVFLI